MNIDDYSSFARAHRILHLLAALGLSRRLHFATQDEEQKLKLIYDRDRERSCLSWESAGSLERQMRSCVSLVLSSRSRSVLREDREQEISGRRRLPVKIERLTFRCGKIAFGAARVDDARVEGRLPGEKKYQVFSSENKEKTASLTA